MSNPVRIAVLGAGLIGFTHCKLVQASPDAVLSAVVDPSAEGRARAEQLGAPWFPDFASMLAAGRPDGVLVATPNALHVEHGIEAMAAGLPVLMEKPLADTVAGAEVLVAAAEKYGVPLGTGHYRRHNPMARTAKSILDAGKLGRMVAVHVFYWLMKPDDYFDVAWRKQAGAGPILVNLSHDIDMLRYLCGEIIAVQAMTSKAIRNFEPEETCVLTLQFASGTLGTVTVSDTVVAPWSWEHTTGENPIYPLTDQSAYHIAGTHGALSLPRLELWQNEGKRSWWEPFKASRIHALKQDPWALQIAQFVRVIRGEEEPLVTGRDGLLTMRVIDAIKRAAATGETVRIAQ
jgi:predicted dehydrogenase